MSRYKCVVNVIERIELLIIINYTNLVNGSLRWNSKSFTYFTTGRQFNLWKTRKTMGCVQRCGLYLNKPGSGHFFISRKFSQKSSGLSANVLNRKHVSFCTHTQKKISIKSNKTCSHRYSFILSTAYEYLSQILIRMNAKFIRIEKRWYSSTFSHSLINHYAVSSPSEIRRLGEMKWSAHTIHAALRFSTKYARK